MEVIDPVRDPKTMDEGLEPDAARNDQDRAPGPPNDWIATAEPTQELVHAPWIAVVVEHAFEKRWAARRSPGVPARRGQHTVEAVSRRAVRQLPAFSPARIFARNPWAPTSSMFSV